MRDIDGECDKPAFSKDRTNRHGRRREKGRSLQSRHRENRRAEPVDNASDLRTERSSQERDPAGLGDKLALRIEGSIVSKTRCITFVNGTRLTVPVSYS
jgi:hypothetical protein